ncbi:TRAP transporter small permease [Aquincola sp. MAHUQ-54]|uniref:TRAP transporter small permease protein n=1 Tax=Aquincola agrisoli TaxID=3119538 RepID=A0AAW9Q5Z0_9BURK
MSHETDPTRVAEVADALGLQDEASLAPPKVPLALEDWLAVLIMGALCLITFANVLVRYLTDQSFAWTEEISIFLMIVLTLVGGCAAVARDRHIKIEYFLDVGSAQRRRRLMRFGALCSAVFFLFLAVLSVRLVWDEYRYEETTPAIGLPKWWFSIWLPVLSLAIAGRALGVFLRQRLAGDAGPGAGEGGR